MLTGITEREHPHAFDTSTSRQFTMSVAEFGVLNPHGEKYQSGLSFPLAIFTGLELILSSVLRQFQESWRHSRGQKDSYTRIVRIIGVRPPSHIQGRYCEYKYAPILLL